MQMNNGETEPVDHESHYFFALCIIDVSGDNVKYWGFLFSNVTWAINRPHNVRNGLHYINPFIFFVLAIWFNDLIEVHKFLSNIYLLLHKHILFFFISSCLPFYALYHNLDNLEEKEYSFTLLLFKISFLNLGKHPKFEWWYVFE